MAAHPRAYLLLLPVYCFLCFMAPHAAALSFSYNFSANPSDLNDSANLMYLGDSVPAGDRINLTKVGTTWSKGRVAYRHPVLLWDDGHRKRASFTTTFSFAISDYNGTDRGDGMAFFIGPSSSTMPPDSNGAFLGLLNNPADNWPRAQTVGVEFDTNHDTRGWDPPNVTADHIGIDVNSIISTNYTALPSLALSGTMSATVKYEASSNLMSVDLLADGTNYSVRATVDLKDAGVPQYATVGFSAATGGLFESHQLLSWSFRSVVRKFSYCQLLVATNKFSEDRVLGQGGFGKVYRGELRLHRGTSRVPVAVKMLTSQHNEQIQKGYVTEIETLCQISHQNLVRLLGWCDHGGWCGHGSKLLLVYELVENENLDKHLHESERPLTWAERYKIVLGVGSAIEHLHTCHKNPVLHRDIKPGNVMLDEGFEAKLGDFGLVRQAPSRQGYLKGTQVIGSEFYIDPICISQETMSTASDVYSFGVLLLEVATGTRPQVRSGNDLVNAVRESYGKGEVLMMADTRLNDDFDRNQMERVLLVGLLCVQQDRPNRPEIRDAVYWLSNLSVHPPVPPVLN